MKKIIILTTLVLFVSNLSAQKIQKGIWQIEIGSGINTNFNWVTGGSYYQDVTINGNNTNIWDDNWSDFYSSTTSLNYNIDATNFDNWEDRFLKDISFGYFFADGFLVGLALDLNGGSTTVKVDSASLNGYYNDFLDINNNGDFNLGATPKIRYYMTSGRGNALFFETSYNIGVNNYKGYEELSGDWTELKGKSFGSSIGIGVGFSMFNFNSREIFAIEPMIGLNINSLRSKTIATSYIEAIDETTVSTIETKENTMGAYFKIKLAFYLGRHFWSH